MQHGLGYEPSRHGGEMEGSGRPRQNEPIGYRGEMGGSSRPRQHYCPVHSRRHHSPVSSSSGFVPARNSSPPAMQSGANGHVRNKPGSRKPHRIFIKKVIEKIILPCF
ncbi:hypothetical protein TanjilG_17713 [Lupinus angustifolius]|uniref:Uncharacterized protein n=1 Tax=Lupinus angustifolius TaxID=3871 RepID=A0A1J7GL61_LUPAN|nr:hypothetical protein TanjilG_17713 [Lupinus angustifolius]